MSLGVIIRRSEVTLDFRPAAKAEELAARVIERDVHGVRIRADVLGGVYPRWDPQHRALAGHEFQVHLQIRAVWGPPPPAAVKPAALKSQARGRNVLA